MNPRNLVAVIIAATVCTVILASVIGALFHPPGSVSETFRLKIFELLIYLMGIVSGWLLRGTDKEPPAEPPKPPLP